MLGLHRDGVAEAAAVRADPPDRSAVGIDLYAPGSTGYEGLKHSVMEVLMKFPPATILRPGHIEETTVGDQWETNGFIRVWRGLDPEGSEPCTAMGEPATLVFLGDDYDGGHKAWVRWPDGRDDIVPGSQISKEG